MTLRLVVRCKGPDEERYSWRPFEPNEHFTDEWWDRANLFGDDDTYIQATLDGAEVGRVHLDEQVWTSHYAGAPDLGAVALEFQFIEIADDHRRSGIASELIGTIADMHPTRCLVAFSEDADEFWASLGWDRYDHPEGPDRYRPPFVQPKQFESSE
jgi:GNAT superfamily N-acetyltransferase